MPACRLQLNLAMRQFALIVRTSASEVLKHLHKQARVARHDLTASIIMRLIKADQQACISHDTP